MNENSVQLTISIVLFKSNASEIKGLIDSILTSELNLLIFLVDNSPTNVLKRLAFRNNIIYHFNNKNVGYGSAHNIAITKSIEIGSPYHVICNPDVELEGAILSKMFGYLEQHKEVGCLVPKILYPDGSDQNLNKLYPTPFDLIIRRFIPEAVSKHIKRLQIYELQHVAEQINEVPIASGCFLFCRNEVLDKIKGFDPRFFMYLEDTDLSRRINEVSKIVFWPEVFIIHAYAKGSYLNLKLLKYHILSAIKYFNKWGWLIDITRIKMNKKFKNKR